MPKARTTAYHGFLLLNKSHGLSSTRALQQVRKAFGYPKAGHGGTLDPMASGLLPLAFGEATKVLPYVLDERKEYQFTVTWGSSTDTLDKEGTLTSTGGIVPTREAIEAVLPSFHGAQRQQPPAYSALKVNGERAYALARQGQMVELAPRLVHITSLALTAHNEEGYSTFALSCSKGTYVRSVARDLATALSTYATVVFLHRTRVGSFTLEKAVSLECVCVSASPASFLLPLQAALDDILALDVTQEQAAALRQGKTVMGKPSPHACTAYAVCESVVVAFGDVSPSGVFSPKRVLLPY
jgi:tRNA pseudouridine55 synthase